MTLDEERRAAMNLHEQTDHSRFIRGYTPTPRPIIERDNITTSAGDLLRGSMIAAILSGDCENER
jgi:hypothetical protein